MSEPGYPECDKLHMVKYDSQVIGEFLDWLQHERKPTLLLCDCLNKHSMYSTFQPSAITVEKLLAEYFGINLDRLEAEKLAILDQARKAARQ
jgi:hypothetical protein